MMFGGGSYALEELFVGWGSDYPTGRGTFEPTDEVGRCLPA